MKKELAEPVSFRGNDPNAYTGTDSERIEKALAFAVKNGLPLEINRRNSGSCWLLDRAILLPENFELRIVDCELRLSDSARDNWLRSANCGMGIREVRPLKNIRIRGVGHAVLSGASHPRATGDSGKTIGTQTFGTDAGKSGESGKGDWRNIGILLADVEDFTIENLELRDSHCWALSLEYCRKGTIRDLRFFSGGVLYIDGKPQEVLNQDGLDLRRGCQDILIENISGWTGDDLVAFTGLGKTDPSLPAGRPGSTEISATASRGAADDICRITLRHVHGFSAGNCQVVRLLNARGVRMHDVVLEDIEDCSPRYLHDNAAVKIGDANPAWGGVTPLGDTARITIRGVRSNSRAAILIAGSLADSHISDVTLRLAGVPLIQTSSGQENLRNVCLDGALFPGR